MEVVDMDGDVLNDWLEKVEPIDPLEVVEETRKPNSYVVE